MENLEFRTPFKVKVLSIFMKNTMVIELEKPIALRCSLETDGTVTCNITKEKFNVIQRKNIKPKKVIFEIE